MRLDRSELSALLARAEAYSLDCPGDVFPFSRRLQREYRWSAAYAQRVVREYKRFAVLAIAMEQGASPSPEVDRVWHLHLTDTRRYWGEFCPRILGQPLHHEPSRGGIAEARKFKEFYRQTLVAYAQLFGEPPPRDIWPAPEVVSKRSLRAMVAGPISRLLSFGGSRVAARLGILSLALLSVGCSEIYDSSTPHSIQGPAFAKDYFWLMAMALALMFWLQRRAVTPPSLRPKTLSHAELGAYELAYLAGGDKRVLATGLLRLYQGGYVGLDRRKRRLTYRHALPEDAPPVERGISDAAIHDLPVGVNIIAHPLKLLRAKLAVAGLVPDEPIRRTARRIAYWSIGPVMALGLLRLVFGVINGRPVGYLIVLSIAGSAAAIVLTQVGTRINQHGARLRDEAKRTTPHDMPVSGSDPLLGRSFALYGVSVIAAVGLDDFRRFIGTVQADGGGGGCGGGGGGCGGGCGG